MSDTKIEWATKVWNPVTGCTPISEGCANCYAARMSRRLAGRYGYPKDEPFQPGIRHFNLLEPYDWKKPQKIFVCSMGDLFHTDVDFSLIYEVFATIKANPQHTFMVLTKRPKNMASFFDGRKSLPPNVWLGVTAENQRTADERIPILLQIPAAKHFVSVEPMLEPVSFTPWLGHTTCVVSDNHMAITTTKLSLDWVIAGPETGPRARPTSIDWVRDLQRQCAAGRIPFFDKRDVLGETIQEWPQ